MKKLVLLVAMMIAFVFTVGCGLEHTNGNGVTAVPFSVSPDPPKIAFASDRDGKGLMELYYMNGDGTGQTKVPLSPDYAGIIWDPMISPDGSKIVFSSYGSDHSDLYSVNVDGSNLTPLTSGADSWSPHFSADGTQIVFTRNTDSYLPHIWMMKSDGSSLPTDITVASSQDYDSAQFSPDGTKIIASRDAAPDEGSAQLSNPRIHRNVTNAEPQQSIVSMDLGGSNEVVLSTESDVDSSAQLSPDGLNIIFAARMTKDAIIAEKLADQTRTALTPTDSNNYDPVVAGGYVYFVSDRNGNSAIYRINVDGTGEIRLTDPAQVSTLGMAAH